MVDLNLILMTISIISPFILAAVWLSSLSARTSNRALLLEVASKNHEQRIKDLEASTSYASIEKIVEKVCLQVFNSREFKASMKESIDFTEILAEMRRMHSDILQHSKS